MLTTLALAMTLVHAPLPQDPSAGSLQRAEMPRSVFWRVASQERPWLGVSLGGQRDLTVTEVQPDSPAERGGVQAGDRILALGGEELQDFAQLGRVLGASQVGDEVGLVVGRPFEIELSDEHRAEDGRPLIGVFLSGNRVTEVQEGRPAEAAGLRKGDRIVAVGGEDTPGSQDVIDALRGVEGGSVALSVARELEVELGPRPEGLASPGPLGVPAIPPEPPSVLRPRQRPMPRATLPQGEVGEEGALREELRALSEEIQSLREEIARLRAELKAMR